MVNDKEVKTAVSPFAVRENEVKVFDGKEGFASINQVVFKMDMGYINESHIKALEVLNEFFVINTSGVWIYNKLQFKNKDLYVTSATAALDYTINQVCSFYNGVVDGI